MVPLCWKSNLFLLIGSATFVLLLLGCEVAKGELNIVWGGSALITTPYSPHPSSAEIHRGIELGVRASNGRHAQRNGVLAKRNISTVFLDDHYDYPLMLNYTSYLLNLPESEFFGFFIGPDGPLGASVLKGMIEEKGLTDVPVVGAWSSDEALRTPFKRWILNNVPGLRAMTYAMVQFLTRNLLLTRISIVVSYTEGSDAHQQIKVLNSTLSSIGLRLVGASGVYDYTWDEEKIAAVCRDLDAQNPQAVIMWISPVQAVPIIIKARKTLPNSVFIADGSWMIDMHLALDRENLKGVYMAFYVPLLSDNLPIVQEFREDVAQFDPDWVPAEVVALHGYLTARWVISILEDMREPLTRANFLKAVYERPIKKLGGVLFGPYSDDCSDDTLSYMSCCNTGNHKVYVVEFPNGTMNYVPNTNLQWEACDPTLSDIKYPYKFGQVVSLTGGGDGGAQGPHAGASMRDGILSAFNEQNSKGEFNGNLVLLTYDDHGSTQETATNYYELLELDHVLAMVGFVSPGPITQLLNDNITQSTLVPLIGSTWASPSLRSPFDREIINIISSTYEEIAAVIDYYLGELSLQKIGIFYERDQDGLSIRNALSRALILKGLTLYKEFAAGSSYDTTNDPPDVILLVNPKGHLLLPFIQSITYETNFCLMSVIEPEPLLKDLKTLFPGDSLQDHIRFTQSLPNPNPLPKPDLRSTTVQPVVEEYQLALKKLHSDAPFGYLSLQGYIIGRFLGSVIGTINGEVTRQKLLKSIYSAGLFEISGYPLGLYHDQCNTTGLTCCNQGSRNIEIVAPYVISDVIYWDTIHTFSFSSCGFDFALPIKSSSSSGDDGWKYALFAIIPAVLMIVLVLLVILLVIYLLLSKSGKEQWEIDYEDIIMGELIGSGGYGEVHKATWKDTEVAVKTIPSESLSKDKAKAFRDEVRTMTDLRHPNVVLFMAACLTRPNMCIVMEYMGLGSLYDVLHNELLASIPRQLVYRLMLQASKGMSFLHSSGIVHRDLKSLNLLLDPKWNIKVSDFGLSAFRTTAEASADGSIPWMAPEVLAASDNLDYATADVYSFGIILFETATRRDPYPGMSPAAIAVSVIRDGNRPILTEADIDSGGGEYLGLMRKCWHQDCVMRPSFLEITTHLERLLDGGAGGSLSTMNSCYSSSSSMAHYDSHMGTEMSSISSSSLGGERNDTHGIDVLEKERENVFIVGAEMASLDKMFDAAGRRACDAILVFNKAMREYIKLYGGMEGKSDLGTMLAVFDRASDASAFCQHVQVSLMKANWPPEILALKEAAEEVVGQKDEIIFRGPRTKMGVHMGNARFFNGEFTGRDVETSRKVTSTALGGQVLMTLEAKKELQRDRKEGAVAIEERDNGLFELIVMESRTGRFESEDDSPAAGTTSSAAANRRYGPASIIDYNEITIYESIGVGNHGSVFRGKWKGMEVAIKKISKQKMGEKAMLDFLSEACMLSELRHPNVITFIGACYPPNLCLVTEYVKQGSLQNIISDKKRMDWTSKLKLLRGIAAGIRYLHAKNIVHRDIKPSNLLVENDWNIKLADFGFARIKEDNVTMTRCGTPSWTAPEIIRGERYSEKADIYSFAIVFWQILFLRPAPYPNNNFMNIALLVLDGKRPEISGNISVPQEYLDLMESMWNNNPDKRPPIDKIIQLLGSEHGDDEEQGGEESV